MITDKHYTILFNKALSLTLKWNEKLLKQLKDKIITEIYQSEEFKAKLNGMLYRNNISQSTGIGDDVLAEVVMQLMKIKPEILIEAYCDNAKRILGLSVTIATRCGFAKMNKAVHPNASVAKQILYKSNLNQSSWLCTNEELIMNKDEKHQLPLNIDDDMWAYIRTELTEDENEFLNFLLDKVLSRKYTESYSRELRKNYYSYNEYRIRRLELQNRIKEIIKNK